MRNLIIKIYYCMLKTEPLLFQKAFYGFPKVPSRAKKLGYGVLLYFGSG